MMMISNKNIFVSFLFSSAILIGLGPNNLGTTSSSSSSSFVVNADITCNTELDFHTWENEKEQRNIPGKQTFEQIATILLETFDEAYSGSNARMISDTFASYQLEHDDPPDADADADADADTDADTTTITLADSRRRRHRGLRSSTHTAVSTEVGGGLGLGLELGLRTTGSLSRGPSKCKTQECRSEEKYRMQSRYKLKPRYSYCGRSCKDDDKYYDGYTTDMMMMDTDTDTDTEAIINLLLPNDDDASSSSSSLNSPAHKKWEYLACKKVKDEIDDYSYGSIENCSINLTGCNDVDDYDDEEDAATIGGVTYAVTDNRDVADSDILYSFTMLD